MPTYPSGAGLPDELKKYRQLARNFVSSTAEGKNSLLCWKRSAQTLPFLSSLARKFLASPGTSVPSASVFSISAYYGRKERTNLKKENLSQSVFLKDKI